jgi:hypothetical protein
LIIKKAFSGAKIPAGLLLFLTSACATMTAPVPDVKVPPVVVAQKIPLNAAILISDEAENYVFTGKPKTPGIPKGDIDAGWNMTMTIPLGQIQTKGVLNGFSQAFEKVVRVKSNQYPEDMDVIVVPKLGQFQYWYKIVSNNLFARKWEAKSKVSMMFTVLDKKGMLLWEKEAVSPDMGGVFLNPDQSDEIPGATANAVGGAVGAAVREALNTIVTSREIQTYASTKGKPAGEKAPPLSASPGQELSKLAVWDLVAREVKPAYAQELTSILVSEISKMGKFEVYSQENVRTLAGWTAERMILGCTDTKCLTALGQMDVARLISGSVGKIGDVYSISLNLFNTQNVKAEKSISEFCRSENELIALLQQGARKLLSPGP